MQAKDEAQGTKCVTTIALSKREGIQNTQRTKARRLRRLPESGGTQTEKPSFTVMGGRDNCDFGPA